MEQKQLCYSREDTTTARGIRFQYLPAWGDTFHGGLTTAQGACALRIVIFNHLPVNALQVGTTAVLPGRFVRLWFTRFNSPASQGVVSWCRVPGPYCLLRQSQSNH